MTDTLPVIVMISPSGPSAAERWMSAGKLAAAKDLLLRLQGLESCGEIFVLAGDQEGVEVAKAAGATVLASGKGGFHFGQALAMFLSERPIHQLAYFGGASAPLMRSEQLEDVFRQILESDGHSAIVNNAHSTDWCVLSHAENLIDLADRFPSDNSLGWVLRNSAGYRVEQPPPSAATMCDIDTPADVLLLAGHPDLGESLGKLIEGLPEELQTRIDRLRLVIRTEGSSLSIIGRSSSGVWKELESRAPIWVRFLVEERGMAASGRQARGEVRSLIAEMVDRWGPNGFVKLLVSVCDAALWDTRVWMAHRGSWPSQADRFASDLGWVEQVSDQDLRELTRAVVNAPIPIITGGHGAVTGGVYGLLDSIA